MYVSWFVFPTLFFSECFSPCSAILTLILRVYVPLLISLSFSFFVSEFLYHSPAVLWLILFAYTSLLRISYSLSLWISVLIFGYIDSLDVYRYVSWSVFLDFSFFVSECLYHCPAVLWLIVSAYTSVLRIIYSLSLWISVLVFGYIDSLDVYMYVSWSVFLSVFSLNAAIGFRLYCYWLSVYRFVSWSVFLSMFLCMCLSIRVYYR